MPVVQLMIFLKIIIIIIGTSETWFINDHFHDKRTHTLT